MDQGSSTHDPAKQGSLVSKFFSIINAFSIIPASFMQCELWLQGLLHVVQHLFYFWRLHSTRGAEFREWGSAQILWKMSSLSCPCYATARPKKDPFSVSRALFVELVEVIHRVALLALAVHAFSTVKPGADVSNTSDRALRALDLKDRNFHAGIRSFQVDDRQPFIGGAVTSTWQSGACVSQGTGSGRG